MFFGGTLATAPLATTQTTATQTSNILAGISTLDELRQIQTGVGRFSAIDPTGFTQTMKDNMSSNITGSMRVDFDIDFGSRSVGGGNSKLIVNTTPNGGNINATMNIAAQSFATGTGQAVFTQTSGGLSGTFTINNIPATPGLTP